MIRITDLNGQCHYLAAQNIARITEAGTSSQWHGIRAFVRTSDGKTIEAIETANQIAALVTSVSLGSLQAEIAGHKAANGHLSALVDELRELLQDAKRAMTDLHQAAVPDESTEGVPAIIPPAAFSAFVDAHAQLCFCMHQRGHNQQREGQRNG